MNLEAHAYQADTKEATKIALRTGPRRRTEA